MDQSETLRSGAVSAEPPADCAELVTLVKKLSSVLNTMGLDPVDENYCSILEQADIAIAKLAALRAESASSKR